MKTAPFQPYTPTNAHEAARRKLWADVYAIEFATKGGTFGPSPTGRATTAADLALRSFDERFSGTTR